MRGWDHPQATPDLTLRSWDHPQATPEPSLRSWDHPQVTPEPSLRGWDHPHPTPSVIPGADLIPLGDLIPLSLQTLHPPIPASPPGPYPRAALSAGSPGARWLCPAPAASPRLGGKLQGDALPSEAASRQRGGEQEAARSASPGSARQTHAAHRICSTRAGHGLADRSAFKDLTPAPSGRIGGDGSGAAGCC